MYKEYQEMANYALPEDILNKTLEYLGTRPFIESAGLIQAIQQNAKKLEEAAPEAVEAPKA